MRRRLIVSIAGVAAVAVALLAVPLGLVLDDRYRSEDLLRLQRDTIAATRQVDLSARGDPIELPSTTDALTVYDRSLRRVVGRGPRTPPRLVAAVLRTGRPGDGSGRGRLRVAVPLRQGERLAGAILAERSDRGTRRDALGAWLVLAGAACAIMAAASVAAVLLARRIATPLERLAQTADRLGEGDFSARAAPTGLGELDAVGLALNSTAQRLDQLVSRERTFSADASHQLRTPLQALRIELEAVQLRGQAPQEIPIALVQVDRLQSTIDTLLTVARDTPRSTTAVTLGSVLEELHDRWHGTLAAEGRPLRIAGSGDTAMRASRHVVREILDVLVDNARRHGKGAIGVTVRPGGAYVAIDVSDEGPGFAVAPEEALARRSAAAPGCGSSDDDGHGIGLALAQSLAHAERGRVVVSSHPSGSTVSLLLPAVPIG